MQKVKQFIEEFYQRISNFIEQKYKICFSIILLIAIFLNVYRFGEVPNGVNVDEAGMGYDAYCIATYGVDRYLEKFPVYFTNFGDGQNALYTYLTAIIIKICGQTNNIIIRLPALILSVIEVIIAYALAKECKGKKFGLLFMAIVTISPWHIMKSRWGLESFLLSPMMLASVYSMIKAIKKKKKWIFFVSGMLFGITLYSYALAYLTVPILLLMTYVYLLRIKQIKLSEIVTMIIPLIVFAIPLVLMIMVNKGWINPIYSCITIQKLPKYKENIITIKNIVKNIESLKYALIEDKLPFNSIKGFGPLYYYLGIPLFIIGLLVFICKKHSIKNKKKRLFMNINNRKDEINVEKIENTNNKKIPKEINFDIIMFFYLISTMMWTAIIDVCLNRMISAYIPITYFIVTALQWISKNTKLLFSIIMEAYLIVFILFTIVYFRVQSSSNLYLFDNGTIELTKYLEKYGEKDKYIETVNGGYYIFELYAESISPYEFNLTKEVEKDGGCSFTKYHNGKIDENELNDNSIYVVKMENNELINKLDNMGFKKENYKDLCYIFYK